jgi:hypothetical protein
MKDINSLTHSCMHSLASFAIFAFSGNAVFMMRATGAKFRISASAYTDGDAGLAHLDGRMGVVVVVEVWVVRT